MDLRRDPWIPLAALAAYVLLGQGTLYNRDAHVLLLNAHKGAELHNHHLLYFPGLNLLRAIAEPLGLGLYRIALLYSALGTAVGVAFAHAANRRLSHSRGEALTATALVACCPAVAFFATVVEVHAPFFAFAGLAFWATARLASQPGPGRAVALGLGTGVAYLAHATGALLPLVLLPVAFTRAEPTPLRSWYGLGALALAAHAVVALSVPNILQALGYLAGSGEAAGHIGLRLGQVFAETGLAVELPTRLGTRLAKEWLWPYVPLSISALLAWRSERAGVLCFALAVAAYITLATVLLWPFEGFDEHGAYLLPLAWPAALLTARATETLAAGAVRSRVRLALLALTAIAALAQIRMHDRPERSRAFAAGLLAHATPRVPFLIVGYYDDVEALVVHLLDDVEHLALQDVLPLLTPASFARVTTALDARIAAALTQGRTVYMTQDAHDSLANPHFANSQPLLAQLLAHLRERYRWEAVASDGFLGFTLSAR